jgi:hypothetical protein
MKKFLLYGLIYSTVKQMERSVKITIVGGIVFIIGLFLIGITAVTAGPFGFGILGETYRPYLTPGIIITAIGIVIIAYGLLTRKT